MRISWTDGQLDISGVISTSRNGEQLRLFGMFARELFRHCAYGVQPLVTSPKQYGSSLLVQ